MVLMFFDDSWFYRYYIPNFNVHKTSKVNIFSAGKLSAGKISAGKLSVLPADVKLLSFFCKKMSFFQNLNTQATI